MLAAIVGGRLQGVEAACLARYAGWRTLVVDRCGGVPAQRMGDRFRQVDVEDLSALDEVCKHADLVIPALENQAALAALVQWGRERGVTVAFDPAAYAVSCSKTDSNRLFASMGIPLPEPWPRCGFPVVAKPNGASGSDGVTILKDPADLAAAFPGGVPESGWVFQQYLDGPSYSLEVVGRPGGHVPLQVTELFMDAGHDCKAVAAPSGLTSGREQEIASLGVAIAGALNLHGLMDVEVILHDGQFKVLEIDARLPSQTPLAVYHSTGVNMVDLLADGFLPGPSRRTPPETAARGVILQHIRVTPESIATAGEHVMAEAGPLHRIPGFYGADEALTDFRRGAAHWSATLIVSGRTRGRAERNRDRVMAAIQRDLDTVIVDSVPEVLA
ncbi:MAG TPA: 3-methylornithine--L-lysine ligase PylC [Desulfosarcina sp.]|nr:3-methylornithine--L-lysine ligase PylC [Desulfosarcina sp.]